VSQVRDFFGAMGQAVADRTILRKGETWGSVAYRVAVGNSSLVLGGTDDLNTLAKHIAKGSILMSGRHLQHGDVDQPERNMEVFTNCSTAAASYIKFYLLLNGSGVGRLYDDDLMTTDWDKAPNIRCVLDDKHPDFKFGHIESLRDGKRKYTNAIWHTVEDSREGWAHAFELWESMTWEGIHKDRLIVFDFSQVRPYGSPIGGMQDRPASGPVPLMRAFELVATLKGLHYPMWKQAMWVDHYLADCVLVGGVRRSARIAGKWWRDPGVLEFIQIKRPTELLECHTISEIQKVRSENAYLEGFLWTANNSICVDDEFWNLLQDHSGTTEDHHLARRVFNEATRAAYADGTGEPGFVTVSKLSQNEDGLYDMLDSKWFGSPKFQPIHSKRLLADISEKVRWKKHKFFVNPCFAGETLIPVLDKGLVRIQNLAGIGPVNIWDGNGNLVEVEFRKTGESQPLLAVEFSDGSIYRVTPEHAFMVDGKRVKARHLEPGITIDGDDPIYAEGTYHDPDWAWAQAWYMCDGTEAHGYIRLYEAKQNHADRFGYLGFTERQERSDRQEWTTVYPPNSDYFERSKDTIPSRVLEGDLATKLAFIQGVLESDGHVGKTSKGFIMQVSSIRRSFLEDLQQLLYSIGALSKISLMHAARDQEFPDGKTYWCKECWRLTVTNPAKVLEYLWPERLTRGAYRVSRQLSVVSITDTGVSEDVYCCTVPTTGSFMLASGMVTGNCGEIVLNVLGGFCVIADVVPYHCDTLEEAEDAVRAATRALIRVNTMDSVYAAEVRRTNRIGVGLTGIHEFAYGHFGFGFRDLLDEDYSQPFWRAIQRLSLAVQDEATAYSKQLGVAVPHTLTTIKPAGTTSKLFGLTEGCHLPSMGCYLRWVQFEPTHPIIAKYEKAGYPVRRLTTGAYAGKTIIGFPTRLPIAELIPEDLIVYAGDATPEEQYQWLRLLEKYWLRDETGNQLSYTLKYKPKDTPYEVFKDILLHNQRTVKCCSVMPQEDLVSYSYQPEEPISMEEYEMYMSCITPVEEGEDVGREHVECAGGACPIDFRET
jgi:ribonucleotide reductase alpha subunit